MGSIPTTGTYNNNNNMKTIYHVQGEYLASVLSEEQLDQVYETEGMFDETGALLGTWCHNDAVWRGEYFEPFMEAAGIEVVGAPSDPVILAKIAEHFVARFCY